MSSRRQILQSSIVVGLFSFAGNLTGMLVETSIAARLGLSRSSDTFYVAFTVPYIITNLMGAGAQFSLVPFFSTLEERHSQHELWRGFSYVFNVVFLGCSLLAVAGAALSGPIVHGIAPGLTRPQIALGARLCQWLFLILIPAGLAEVYRSFLLSQKRFALAAGANIIRNVTVIMSVLFAFNQWGEYSMVVGYLVGYILQFLVLGTRVVLGFPVRYTLVLVGRGEEFRNLYSAGAAQLVAAAGWQAVVLVERIIASFLPPGSLTALNYGFKIMSTLSELLAGSVGTAALPVLSRASATASQGEALRMFRHTLQIALTSVLPVTVFCLMLPQPIIRFAFQRGNFTVEATRSMSSVFFYYSLSLLLASLFRVLGFYLFALNRITEFLRLLGLYLSLWVGFDLVYVFVWHLGAKGIPLGLFTNLCGVSWFVYRRNLGGIRAVLDRDFEIFAGKSALSAGLAALGIWLLRTWLRVPQSALGNVVYLCVLCGVGALLFLFSVVITKALSLQALKTAWQSRSS